MSNIQLPITTDLPVVEPLARTPRSSGTSGTNSSFDDHLERAAQPANKSSQRIENEAPPTRRPEADQPTESAAEPANDTDDSGLRESGQEADTLPSDADKKDNTSSEEADPEDNASDTVVISPDLLVEPEIKQVKAEGSTKTDSGNVKSVSPTAAESSLPVEQTVEDNKQQVDGATEESTHEQTDGEIAKQTQASTDVEIATSAEETDDRTQSAVIVSGEDNKTATPNDGTNESKEAAAPVAANDLSQEQADGEDKSRQKSERANSPNDKAPRDAESALSSLSNAILESQNSNEIATGGDNDGDADHSSQTDARQEIANAASQLTTPEGSSEQATAPAGSVESANGDTSPTTRVTTARPDASSASEGNLNEAQRVRFVQRIAGAFKAAEDRDGSISVRLSPPDLGSLRLQMTVRQGVIVAQLETETPEARRLLLENLPELRDRLAQQDIKIDRFDVNVRDESRGQSSEASDGKESSRDGQSGQDSNDSTSTNEEAATETGKQRTNLSDPQQSNRTPTNKSDKTKIPTTKRRSHRYQNASNRVKKPWQIPKQPNQILKSLTKTPAVLARAAS